ncbi:hypothetical protein H257_11920 [Aphanomyces astaci]|uniref:CCHC-type domain-containing protein n=1 Tax=Aphanomyces astaci TaxID=112090 RepID=W4G1F6_APHAT|nr:hypothetical protein H257_11920 [Aphanomyces astaci]ETV73096.1 hypothetical protein H257_11920 [Aphanomyces astaci]|eukprot:XP_009837301.1 hypothetical protein H257_11920 [Aphanomyces astaci]
MDEWTKVSIGLYIHQVTTFFKAKNVDYQEDDGTQQRCIVMMVANFRGLAAAWYQDRLSRGAKFRRICTQVCDMTERDKFNNRHQGSRPPHAYLQRQRQDDDMEVDNAQVQHRGQRQVGPFYNCGRMGHRISDCRSPPRNNQGRSQAQPQRNNNSRHANRPQRAQCNKPSRQHNTQVTKVNSDTEGSEDDVEEVILGNNMGLAQQDSAEEESLNINTAQQAVPAQENKLMIVHGALDSTSVRILIDSGASNLLCRPGLVKTVIRSKEVQAEGFDGHCSGIKKVKEVSGTLCFGQWTFPDLILTEWDLGKKDFDVILGKPWFFRCNPVIDWRTHQILNVNSSEVEPERIEGWMIKVTTKTEPQQKLHPLVARVVEEFRDVPKSTCERSFDYWVNHDRCSSSNRKRASATFGLITPFGLGELNLFLN